MTGTATEKIAKPVQILLISFFFISGACGLIYEVVWLRVLGLVFGNTTYATSAVIAGYMAGLGLGALYFGKRVDAHPQPIRLYGMLEGGVALYSFLTPLIWILIEKLFVGFARTFQPSFGVASFFKLIISFVVLFVPTFLMGGTLPALSKFFVRSGREMAKRIGLLYALNTLGAVVGVVASGFFLLYTIGVWQSVILTGMMNLAIFLVCQFYLTRFETSESITTNAMQPASVQAVNVSTMKENSFTRIALLVLFAVSGGVSMFYEVGWTRVLAIALGSSVYAFAVMLATFLLGIAIGSYIFSILSSRMSINLSTFAVLQAATAVLALVGLNFFDDMPYYFVKLFEHSGGSIYFIEAGKFLLCGAVMLPPTIFFGALFACFIHIYHHSDFVGGEVGQAYFANTLGTIFGSLLAGFILIPLIGIQSMLILAAWINVFIGLFAIMLSAPRIRFLTVRQMILMAVMVIAVGIGHAFAQPWNTSILTSGAMVTPQKNKGASKAAFTRSLGERSSLFYKEGLGSTVSVNKTRDYIAMSVNGKVEASNADDVFTQSFLGHLPLLIHPSAERVAIVGVGSAATLAAVTAHPVKHVDAIEIEKAVIDAAKYFEVINRDSLHDPRVNVVIDDGRNFLLVHEEPYDVIISQPSNPWMAGVANLFSREHYQTMQKRLKPGGVICQWLQTYSMSTEDLRMIIKTFSLVFPHVSLWTSYTPDLMLIGSNDPMEIDFTHLQEAWQNPIIRQDFEPHGIAEPEGFFSTYLLGDSEIKELAKGALTNSDNYPYLEFRAPRSLYRQTVLQNIQFINQYRASELPSIIHMIPPPDQNQELQNALVIGYARKAMYVQAKEALRKSLEINPGAPGFAYAAGFLNYRLDNYDEAWPLLESAIQASYETAEAHYILGVIATQKGLTVRAAVEFEKAHEMEPDKALYVFSLAQAAETAGKLDVAFQLYAHMLEMPWRADKPSNFDALMRMIDMTMKQGEFGYAKSLIDTMIKLYPESIYGYEKNSQLLEAQNRLDEVLAVTEEMARLFPDNPAPQFTLARLYDILGNAKASHEALERVVKLDPSLKDKPEIVRALSLTKS